MKASRQHVVWILSILLVLVLISVALYVVESRGPPEIVLMNSSGSDISNVRITYGRESRVYDSIPSGKRVLLQIRTLKAIDVELVYFASGREYRAEPTQVSGFAVLTSYGRPYQMQPHLIMEVGPDMKCKTTVGHRQR